MARTEKGLEGHRTWFGRKWVDRREARYWVRGAVNLCASTNIIHGDKSAISSKPKHVPRKVVGSHQLIKALVMECPWSVLQSHGKNWSEVSRCMGVEGIVMDET